MEKIINYLKNCQKREVIVIGDIILDEYLFGSVERLSSEAPIPIVNEQYYKYCLGAAGNFALNCVAVGLNTKFISIVGQDDFGQRIFSLLKDSKISHEGIIRSKERKTTVKKRVIVKNQQLICIDSESVNPLSKNELNFVIERCEQFIKPGMAILISDYDRGLITSEFIFYLIQKARSLDCIIMVDPSGPHYLKYKGVDYLKPNLNEFVGIVKSLGLNEEDEIDLNARRVCKALNIGGIFITLGERGIKFVSKDKVYFNQAQTKKEIYGLAGAGDTVFAYLVLGLVCGLKIDICLQLANAAAAISISHIRTYAVGLDELIDRKMEYTKKIFNNWMHLKIELDWQSNGGKRVVFTNGCFDILHVGHMYLLKEAKKMGDILVLGINTDDSIKRLGKGEKRPINSLQERAEVVAALEVVDFVVPFDQDTPEELLKYLKPDIFVKGGDYNVDTMIGSDIVKSYGGQVRTVEYLSGFSTTSTVEKINNLGSKVTL